MNELEQLERVKRLYKVGDRIHIDQMSGEPQYDGKEGEITHIDDIGQIHGTWGGCALIFGIDRFFKK